MTRRALMLVGAAGFVGLAISPVAARAQADGNPRPAVAPVPFGPGEKLSYRVTVGRLGRVGEGAMEVLGLEVVRGKPTYRLQFRVQGGILFARVNTRMESWMDVSTLVARRFEQDQNEVRYERHRVFDFYPEERRWTRLESDESGDLPTDEPLDQVSFLYFARTIPLEVGETYTFDRYFQERGNPVMLRVLRRETVTVPAGTFDTIVIQPIIQTRGLFSEGGKAEVYLTDDDRRLLVQMKSRMPVLGSLNLYLEEYTAGQQLNITGRRAQR